MRNYTNNEKALIYLSQFSFMTATRFKNVLDLENEPFNIFSYTDKQLEKFSPILKEHFNKLKEEIKLADLDDFMDDLEDKNVQATTILSDDYPNRLTNLSNPPAVLFYAGDLSLASNKGIAIVGTRTPTPYGEIVTEKFAGELAENGLNIISGLASGVDTFAHKGALNVNGKTIAVLGGGFDNIYPPGNKELARKIAKTGLVITEYFPTVKPSQYTFPTRNRIIAALSNGILITEAKSNSGSRYTKEAGEELELDIFAVPGNINNPKSYIPNSYIKNGSALCALSADDILTRLGIKTEKGKKKGKKKLNSKKYINLSMEMQAIISLLEGGEQDYEFLQEKTKFSPQILNFNLTSMEISGIIKKLAGNTYSLAE